MLVALLMVGGMAVDARTNAVIDTAPIVATHAPASDPTIAMFTGFDLENRAATHTAVKKEPVRTWRGWVGFAVGLLVGAPLGMLVLALCVIAKRSDEDLEQLTTFTPARTPGPWQEAR